MKSLIQAGVLFPVFLLLILTVVSPKRGWQVPAAVSWKLEDTNRVADQKPGILGNPLVMTDDSGKFLYFNGVDDGIWISKIPIQGWKQFTIEVLFKPSGDGPVAPRFIHFEDKDLNRGTFEIRLTGKGSWYMDTFLKNGRINRGLTLIDSDKLHPVDKWYWAALVYDGKKMSSYVNGARELEGEIDFPPMTAGAISIGVRLNRVNWYKGAIREIRFHPAVLEKEKMQRL